MLTSEITLEERFEPLSPDERRVAHFVAQGCSDSWIASQQNVLDEEGVRRAIEQVATKMQIGGETYPALRAAVAVVGQKFFTIEPHPGNPPSLIEEEEAVDAVDGNEKEEGVVAQTAAPQTKEDLPQTVNIDELVYQIGKLKSREREVIEAIANAKRGEKESAASKVGLAAGTLTRYTMKFYARLELNRIRSLKKRKEYMREALRRLKIKEAQGKTGSLTPAPEPQLPEPAQSSSPVEVLPPAKPLVESPAQKMNGVEHLPAPVPAFATGPGIVIPLPAGVTNVDVLSEVFDNKSPGLKEAIQERRAQGLKPTFFIFVPSLTDPRSSQGHIVFLEEEGK